MVISNVVGHHIAFLLPVGLVIVCVVLVFAFGFKSSVPPNFKQLSLSSDERKSLKKRKLKEKKAQTNGHATVIIDGNEGKAKPLKQSNKADINKVNKVNKEEVKKDNQKSSAKGDKKVSKGSGKENQEPPTLKKKKNEKVTEDKPNDFDEGEWETAFSRKDKKNRKKEDDPNISTPEKTPKKKSGDKKSPKKEKAAEEEKPLSPKKNNQQSKVLPSSPEGKKGSDTKTGSKASPEKKKLKVETAEAEKGLVVEPKPQRSTNKEKKQTGNSPSLQANSATESPVKTKASGQSGGGKAESEPVSNELDDQWKEAPQKKSKKKVRKD